MLKPGQSCRLMEEGEVFHKEIKSQMLLETYLVLQLIISENESFVMS